MDPREEALWAVAFTKLFFDDLATRVPGNITLNELRVRNYMVHAQMFDEPKGVSSIARALEIPQSTVSHIVQRHLQEGVAIEKSDDDGRKKLLLYTQDSWEKTYDWARNLRGAALTAESMAKKGR